MTKKERMIKLIDKLISTRLELTIAAYDVFDPTENFEEISILEEIRIIIKGG